MERLEQRASEQHSVTLRSFLIYDNQRDQARRSEESTRTRIGRCRSDTDPARHRTCPRRRLGYLKLRSHSSVSYLQPAASTRRLWEAQASWNLITPPATLMSVPSKAVIAFFLNLDSLIWCVHSQTLSFSLQKSFTVTSTKQNVIIRLRT